MACNVKNIFYSLLFVLCVSSIKADTETSAVSFVPSEYQIHIITTKEHFQDSTKPLEYDGEVKIDFKRVGTLPAEKDFDIVLNINKNTNQKKLKVKLEDVGETPAKELPVTHKVTKNTLVLTCKKDNAGVEKFRLTVNFANPFGEDMTGFYRSSYKEGSETKWLLTTHFEPIYARDAFPCFDQPKLKAKFTIMITAPKDKTTVLSNTGIENSKPEGDNIKHIFKPTAEVMSTYLVAFTVSDLVGTDPVTFGGSKTLKTFGRKEIITRKDGDLAQGVAKEAINKLAEYLDVPYTFDKIDQVGIPDFSAGAMENWGHISFREKSLFFNKESGSTNTKQANTLTITHELVHQWFGNLVTLESWDYIWLNEAFANYLEFVIASQLPDVGSEKIKDWELMKQLVVSEIHLRAFETDGLASSKPLNYKITDENLIESSFNDIPYCKGAAVLRMWNAQLEDAKFKSSLQKYIKDRKGSTANPTQLFEFFKPDLNEDDFKTWTDQPGYPVVEIKKENGTKYNIIQNRFLWEKPSNNDSIYWRIPITFSTDQDKKFEVTKPWRWLEKNGKPVPTEKKWKWVVVNNQQAGYYRVNYDKENWIALSEALLEKNFADIPELNRAQIVNDVLSLARSLQKEYVDYGTALNLTKYLKNENSFVAWKTALNAFEFLQIKLYNEKFYDKFKEFVLSLVKPHYKSLSPTDLTHVEKLKNVEISRWACSLEFDKCVKEAKDLFSSSNYTKYPDTQEIILCTAVRNDEKAWNAVFEKYKSESDSALKVMYLSALGCSSKESIIKNYLDKTLNSTDIRKQDLIYVLTSVYNGNLKNVELAFKFIEKNFEKIAEMYGGINPLGKALVGIAKRLKTGDQLKRMEALTAKIKTNTKTGSAADSADNALNLAKSSVKWMESRMKQVETYLNSGSLLSYSFALLLSCLFFVFQFKH